MKNKIKIFVLLLLICAATTYAQKSKTAPKTNITEGYSLIDGDIQMPTEFVRAILRGQKPADMAPQATYRTNLWTDGIIPFEFDANVSEANQSLMISAMELLENTANVEFRQCFANFCLPLSFHVHIQSSTVNNSAVGMVGFGQIINIVSWGNQFIIAHELLHCLGFYHEQSRADRGTFVQVNCNNVQGGCNGTIFNNNFVIEGDAENYGVYDFDSVMHYSQCAFTTGSNCPTDGTQTITVLAPNQNQQGLIGQGGNLNHLSVLDRATLSFLYPYDDWVFYNCNAVGIFHFGTFLSPYNDPIEALENTPAGGTLWVLDNCAFPNRTYNQSVKVRVAPNVIATFGN